MRGSYSSSTNTYASSLAYAPDRSIKTVPLGNLLTENTAVNRRFHITSRNLQNGSVDPLQLTLGYGRPEVTTATLYRKKSSQTAVLAERQ